MDIWGREERCLRLTFFGGGGEVTNFGERKGGGVQIDGNFYRNGDYSMGWTIDKEIFQHQVFTQGKDG